MLILPIKRKWLEMIRSGKKKEEYREIKSYYTARFRHLMTYAPVNDERIIAAVRSATDRGGIPIKVILRGGYDLLAPAILVKGTLVIGEGKPEWGAEPGKEYYVIRIEGVEDLITDSKSYARDGDTPFQLIECQQEGEGGGLHDDKS